MAKKRTVIGLIFSYDENWIAGTYYVQNLIHAVKTLPDDKKFHLNIYTSSVDQYNNLISKTKYPFTTPIIIKYPNRIKRWLNRITSNLRRDRESELIFPNPELHMYSRCRMKLFWIPDFQEKYFPEFFSQDQLLNRKISYDNFVVKCVPIVFSSEHARNDFYSLYPNAKNPTYVMPFAVTLPNFSDIDWTRLQQKFNIAVPFFICSNQFWRHKNHMVVLQAVKILKEQGNDVTVIFTGKPNDFRNPTYYQDLLNFVEDNNLKKHILFLGFIEREEQLMLMKMSLAIIQPSLFEGWSTVVEDAKALNKTIIVSDIAVHREQLINYPLLFTPSHAQDLVDKMRLVLDGFATKPGVGYVQEIEKFGKRFYEIIQNELGR
jgi:glycosyltransferase involved in cell wall biosynthesis